MPWQVARATTPEAAIDIDRAQGTARVEALTAAAARGHLWTAADAGGASGYLSLDPDIFFGKPFVALLVVRPEARRQGVACALLDAVEAAVCAPLWTSTNRSNLPMQALLQARGWIRAGEIDGLDPGDPEIFFHAPTP